MGAPFEDEGACDTSMWMLAIICVFLIVSLIAIIVVFRMVLQEREFMRRAVETSVTRNVLARGTFVARRLAEKRNSMRLQALSKKSRMTQGPNGNNPPAVISGKDS